MQGFIPRFGGGHSIGEIIYNHKQLNNPEKDGPTIKRLLKDFGNALKPEKDSKQREARQFMGLPNDSTPILSGHIPDTTCGYMVFNKEAIDTFETTKKDLETRFPAHAPNKRFQKALQVSLVKKLNLQEGTLHIEDIRTVQKDADTIIKTRRYHFKSRFI